MQSLLDAEFQKCGDVSAALDCVLECSLELTGTRLGNVQLMDWKAGYLAIAAQRGFGAEFLTVFRRVELDHGTACGRALKSRTTVVIDDVMTDPEFSPYREVAGRAGFRAVQSTPLVSRIGAFVGVLSTHFGAVGRPTTSQLQRLQEAAELAANAIIRLRANDHERLLASSRQSLEHSYRSLDHAEKLLARRAPGVIGRDRVAGS